MHRYELVPELAAWEAHNGTEETPVGWASCMGSFSLAAAYALLVWPTFTEVRGMVFRGDVDASDVDSWFNAKNATKQIVQATLNHLHVLDVQHPGIWSEATESQLKFLGETLRNSWSAKLALDFPAREFVVEFLQGSAEDLREYQVTFYEREA